MGFYDEVADHVIESEDTIKKLKKRITKLEAAINYALGCGIMTERVCKKLEQALKGE